MSEHFVPQMSIVLQTTDFKKFATVLSTKEK